MYIFQVFDATAKLPDGLMGGNNHLVGAIHECMDVKTPSLLNWNGSLIEGFKYVNCVNYYLGTYKIHDSKSFLIFHKTEVSLWEFSSW